MLARVEEHNELHRFLLPAEHERAVVIVFFLVAIHFIEELIEFGDLLIRAGFGFAALHEVAVDDALGIDDFGFGDAERAELTHEESMQVLAIRFRRASIVEHAHVFMVEDAQESLDIGTRFRRKRAHALEYLPNITQVKRVVRLRRGRQQVDFDLIVDLQFS